MSYVDHLGSILKPLIVFIIASSFYVEVTRSASVAICVGSGSLQILAEYSLMNYFRTIH